MITGHLLKTALLIGFSWQLFQAAALAEITPKNLSAQSTSDCLPPPEGLVSWWTGENDVSDQINGSAGSLMYGATYAPGLVGNAFSVAGGSWVQIPNSTNINFFGTQAMTLELWVNCRQTELPAHIATKSTGGGDYEYRITFDNYGGFKFICSAYQTRTVVSQVFPQTNTWYHLACSADGTTLRIYVNGELAGSTSGTLGSSNNAPLTLGALNYQGSPYPFDGLIDEVSLYNRTLSAEEIRAIYQAGSAGKCFVPTPPIFIAEPQSLTVDSGSEATFSARAVGSGPLAYQWQFEGQSLENETNPVLHLSNVQPVNAGTYTVIAVNEAGFITSTGAVLTVKTYPPTITTQPKSSTRITAGNPYVLTATATGTYPLNYQWSFNGTPLPGETNSSFRLAAAQPANTGIYAVAVTNLYGNATSSNAVLEVTADAPSIITQPQGRQVVTGNPVTLSVVATGSRPLDYQWRFNGENLPDATNSSLFIASTVSQNAGNYDLVVTNAYGAVTSRVAVLAVVQPPIITAQPANQRSKAGTDVTFTASAIGDAPMSFQWFFEGNALTNQTNTSLTLTGITVQQNGGYSVAITNPYGAVTSRSAILEVIGDCVPAPSGITAWWRAESNTVDWLSGKAGLLKNGATFAEGRVGQAFSLTNGAFIEAPNSPAVDFHDNQSMSIEAWIYRTGNINAPMHIVSKRNGLYDMEYQLGCDVNFGLAFASGNTWSSISAPSYITPPLNTWCHIVGTANGTNLNIYVNGVLAGSIPGTLGPQNAEPVRIGAIIGDNGYPFVGLIDEVAIYNRTLSADEIKSLYEAGGAGKCTAIAPSIVAQPPSLDLDFGMNVDLTVTAAGAYPLTYQWQLGGTNLLGATNAMLSLTNVGLAQAGTYSVVVANEYGYATSTGAVLQVIGQAPTIQVATPNLRVDLGSDAFFYAYATGTQPLRYQWQFNDADLPNETNWVLSITNAQASQEGNYRVTVANDFGSITSTNVYLVVVTPPSQVRLESAVASNNILVVPITLEAQGTENAISFSLNFEPRLLIYSGVTATTNAAGLSLLCNTNYATNGSVGMALALPTGETFPAGTQQVVYATFRVTQHTNAVSTMIYFDDQPTARQVISARAASLPANFFYATVYLPFASYEGDVAPLLSGGDYQVNIQDWVEVGRLVAGLDLATNASIFQRADCAPRAEGGNGLLSVADWVQAGRYAAGLDPLTEAAGPFAPPSGSLPPAAWGKTGGSISRALALTTTNAIAGQTQTVTVQLAAQGDENGLEFSVAYDPTVMSFISASPSSSLPNAQLILNTNKAASGLIGVVLALPTGTTIAPATQEVVKLSFAMAAHAMGHTKLAFTNSPLPQQVVDVLASDLEVAYQEKSFAIVPSTGNPSLAVTASKDSLSFSWPAWAAGYVIEASTNLNQNGWTIMNGTTSTNGDGVNLVLPLSTNEPQRFYRLRYP